MKMLIEHYQERDMKKIFEDINLNKFNFIEFYKTSINNNFYEKTFHSSILWSNFSNEIKEKGAEIIFDNYISLKLRDYSNNLNAELVDLMNFSEKFYM